MAHLLSDFFSSADVVRQRQLDEVNNRSRLPYLGARTDKFFSTYRHALRSTAASGGSAPFRAAVVHGILRQYAAQGVPTVVLHCGSPWLSCSAMAAGAVLPDGQLFHCDPLLGSSPDAVAELLTDLSQALNPSAPPLGGLWELVLDVLSLRGDPVTLSALCGCSCRNLPEELDRLRRQGALDGGRTAALLDRLSALPAGALETGDQLLRKLRRGAIATPGDPDQAMLGMAQAVELGGLASIDLVSDSNLAAKELCFLVLRRLMENGRRFLVVCDGLSLSERTVQMQQFFRGIAPGVRFLFSGPDVPVQLQTCPGLLESMIKSGDGGANAVIFFHTSPTGKDFWLHYLGSYRHRFLEQTYSRTRDSAAILRHSEGCSCVIKEEIRRVMEEEELRTLPDGYAAVVLPAERKRGILIFQALRPAGIS
ncbi:hypothetical protein [uncultured Pseudoflavonifractor sp.]|uniref:hypothetical protein n=1 Tax=uncultured Pseudoflavonifractor sp. TaxID=1221379 RepID=UPI0025D0A2D3|nr:hypothetical protein [uncultured Pseudoflavonifractor sp.]